MRRERSWRDKFGEAIRGLKLGVRGQSSFAVHVFFTVMVIATAAILQCSHFEWCLLIGCIGGVMTVELFNSALETLFRGLDAETKERLVGVLDISAGAVLLASLTAVAIGVIVFGQRVAIFLR